MKAATKMLVLTVVELVVGDVGVEDLQCFICTYEDGVDVPQGTGGREKYFLSVSTL